MRLQSWSLATAAAVAALATLAVATPAPRTRRVARDAADSPVGQEEEQEQRRQYISAYLHRYGYLVAEEASGHEFRRALLAFQRIARLDPTGEADAATEAAARRERCAQPDAAPDADITGEELYGGRAARRKRFVLTAKTWGNEHFVGAHELKLKWYVSQYTKDINRNDIKETIKKAFQLWSMQSVVKKLPPVSLTFVEAASEADADINIMWTEGDHGDDHKFDGLGGSGKEGNVLAHTFYPDYKPQPLNGDIHFDDAEKWDLDPSKNTFFPYVLAHEIGHALGLQHSRKESALMFPMYKNVGLDKLRLDIDDKCGINWNYAGPSNFCLFVWLTSEIVPSQHNHSLQAAHMMKRLAYIKGTIKEARIPRCLGTNNVQMLTQKSLIRNLHFTPSEAHKYSEIACNFLSGIHEYRGSAAFRGGSDADTIESEFGAVHEFAYPGKRAIRHVLDRAERRRRRGLLTVLDPAYFDHHFFETFLRAYVQ